MEHLWREAVQVVESVQRVAQDSAARLPAQRRRVVAAKQRKPLPAVGREHQPVLKAAAASKRVDETEAACVRAEGDDAKQVRVRAARQDVDLASQLDLTAASCQSLDG